MVDYDSRPDTWAHISRVQTLMDEVGVNLAVRANWHDYSKLEEPEKPLFDEMTPKLKGMTYGSEEYKQALADLKPALDHHYAENSHHPEHYPNGIEGMSLLDLIEMLCDWKAASERHADGDIVNSLAINAIRFEIDPQLLQILDNTAKELGYRGESDAARDTTS